MIISRGWGLLGLLLPIAVVLLGIYFFSPDGNTTKPILAFGFVISGILTAVIGVIFQKKSNNKHDLFFMPLSIWGIIWIVLGVFIYSMI